MKNDSTSVRRKFEEHDPAFSGIDTVHGLGYRWQEPAAGS